MEGILFLAMLLWCWIGNRFGIYIDNISGYIWHSVLAVLLGKLIFLSAASDRKYGEIWALILWIARNEYGIYIWHLMIMENLMNKSELLINLRNDGRWIIVIIIQLFFAIATGSLIGKSIDAIVMIYMKNKISCNFEKYQEK